VDLEVTSTVDILVKKTDTVTKRISNALSWEGDSYARVDLAGNIQLTNYRKQAVEVEIARNVLGNIADAKQNGKVETLNVLEDTSFLPAGDNSERPFWWTWWNWPYWWSHFNGVSRVVWKQKLDPGKDVQLNYTWSYYWR
jgi:hypothetical protein